jgi:hypothetical protein
MTRYRTGYGKRLWDCWKIDSEGCIYDGLRSAQWILEELDYYTLSAGLGKKEVVQSFTGVSPLL